jgi:cation transport ATPase
VSGAADAPRLRFVRDGLHIEFARLFGPGAEGQPRRLARRVFALPEVCSLHLEPDAGKASVQYRLAGDGLADFLDRLASALGGTEDGLEDALLPLWLRGEPVTLHRFGGGVSVFGITQAGPGRLQLRHPALALDPALGSRVADAVRALDGVVQAMAAGGTGALWVSYQPDVTDTLELIRAAEAQLAAPRTALAALDAGPSKLGLANATLGLAAIGEFALPVVLPVCVGMLVATNLDTLRDAAKQLGQGKAGMPVLYTALLGCSITTGQIVAHALMEWSFRFWAQRSDAALARECRVLLEESLPIPARSRVARSDEVDAQVPTETLQAGDRIRIDAPAAIPADGRVVAGAALVEETAVCGSRASVRKSFGDKVFAGSLALAGTVEVEVWQAGPQTRAAQIAGRVIEGTRGLTRNPALRRRAAAIADRTVLPSLAGAGFGWAVGAGGLFTAGAVLHADYATGPGIAVPLEALRGMGLALRSGAVVCSGDALHRLDESRFVVLDDHSAWALPGLELERMDHRLAGSETDNLLRHVAGAGLYLGDERAGALADASLALGQVIRQPPLLSLDAGKVAVRQGQHTLILRNGIGTGEGAAIPLTVEIDGEAVATLRFRHSAQPRAAAAVSRLRRQGMTVFLLSGHTTEETDRLARRLGIELSGGDFSPAEKLRFLQGLRRRGVRATYIGNSQAHPELGHAAHVSVSLGGAEGLPDALAGTDIVVLGDALDAFAEVAGLALGHGARIRAACRKSLLPNLLCAVGGYAGVLNGITAGLLANVGVNNVYRQAAHSLRDSRSSPLPKRISV